MLFLTRWFGVTESNRSYKSANGAGRLVARRLTRRAADLHGILTRREPKARRVLQALFNERLAFTPFDEGPTRGYQFFGTGSYGGLLVGDTCPTSNGGPNGIRALVGLDLTFSIRGVAIRH